MQITVALLMLMLMRPYRGQAPDEMGLPPPPPPEDSRVERPWKKEPSREGALPRAYARLAVICLGRAAVICTGGWQQCRSSSVWLALLRPLLYPRAHAHEPGGSQVASATQVIQMGGMRTAAAAAVGEELVTSEVVDKVGMRPAVAPAGRRANSHKH